MKTLDVISFGAGVQSTAMVYMALHGDLSWPDAVIFADTQSEPAAVYDNVKRVRATCELKGLPFHEITAGNLMDDVLAAIGTPEVDRIGQPPFFVLDVQGGNREGRLWRKCTTEYKIEPLKKKARELLGVARAMKGKHEIRQWLGITTDEIQRMKFSAPPYLRKYPLIEKRMSRNDCVNWLSQHGYEIPSKSACVMCPFRSSAYWLELQRNAPDDWDRAIRFDADLRSNGLLPGVRNPAYVHRSCQPLSDVVFQDERQMDLFMDECEGVCGV
jgi:hypothetical protein